ncbi:hypothetical protein [Methylobacterium aerolatum]|uniref:DNA-binding transcriptional regulator YdaS (Cro superfamily) n=1 Tax=Methylobacterium aerolatum TaxID=418708 RepID=A0ABU0HW93_9HYPH|nr:hypothetical protein [Methylobacterium aerolatum]MDQ0446618.1 DNA-binding transcriptional regulator YdaS (Cro superfamily) [Methylobacterium aerolatum]GJD33221.1 hypothetical protein FMGBMHLM_0107 [Methylobacterium aerolatum]
MRRSGFYLGIGVSAAVLTFWAQPVVQASADGWAPAAPIAAIAPQTLPGMRPASIALSPTRLAGVERAVSGQTKPATEEAQEIGPKPMKPLRRLVREGCELPVSALAGPEARRLTPGRCIS